MKPVIEDDALLMYSFMEDQEDEAIHYTLLLLYSSEFW